VRRNPSNWLPTFLVLLAPLFAVACGTTYSSPPPQSRPGEIEGSQYETMRVLAGRLVENLEVTRSELRATRTAEAEMPLLTDLLERARRFRDGMGNYANPPRYVRDDVNELDRMARDYDSRTRNVQASTRAVEAWRAAQDVLDRMQRVLAGQDVDIPPAGRGPDFPTYPPSSSTSPYGSVLTGSALEDFRRTAHEVVVRATLARDTAERSGAVSSDTDRRLLADMSYFLSGARDLDSRAQASTVDRRDVRPFVERLTDDARRIDSALRSSSALSRSSSDWSEVLRLLQRLSDLTR